MDGMADLPMGFNEVETRVIQHLRKSEFEAAQHCARQGIEIDAKTSEQMVTIRAKCLLGRTLASYARAKGVADGPLLREAETFAKEAHELCLAVRIIELEPETSLAIAAWYQATGQLDAAAEAAVEALVTASRSEVPREGGVYQLRAG